jgi:hypothetical protein
MKFSYSVLTSAMLLASHPVYALEALSDAQLSSAHGADGLAINALADSITMDQLYWEDKAGTSPTGDVAAADSNIYARFDNVRITPRDLGSKIQGSLTVNAGSNAGVPALNINLSTNALLFYAEKFYACTSASGSCTGDATKDAASNSGEWAIKTSGLNLSLSTTKGLFNKTGNASVKIIVDQMDIFITQPQPGNPTVYNQIILGDIRANIDANGSIWVDAQEGIRFNGSVNLGAKPIGTNGYRAGLQFALKQKNNVGNSSTSAATRYDSSNAGNLLRLGLSGDLTNVNVALRGVNDDNPTTNKIFGRVNGSATGDSIVGSAGIGLSVSGELSPTNFSLELGESDTENGRSLKLYNMVSLSDPANTAARATFDLGNIYVNQISTDALAIPVSAKLSSVLDFNTEEDPLATNGLNYLTLQQSNGLAPSTVTGGMLSFAMRGASIQALPTKTAIINNKTGANTMTPIDGGLVFAVNNLNTNVAFYGDNNQAGFVLGMSTEGLDSTNKKTTSILLADTRSVSGVPVNRYVGLRNIDMLLQTSGTIAMNGSSIQVTLPYALLAFNGEVAVGNLMNGTTNFSSDSDVTNNSKKDVLFGLRGKLEGSAVVNLVPTVSGALGIKLDIDLTRVLGDRETLSGAVAARTRKAGSFLHIVEPSDGSTLGFENISGRIQVVGATVATENQGLTIDVGDNNLVFEGRILVNQGRTLGPQAKDLRVGNINFYPSNGTLVDFESPQRLGEIAMPGGELYAKLTVKLAQ